MTSQPHLRFAVLITAVLLITGIVCYAAFSPPSPAEPVRLMFQNDAGKVLFTHQTHTERIPWIVWTAITTLMMTRPTIAATAMKKPGTTICRQEQIPFTRHASDVMRITVQDPLIAVHVMYSKSGLLPPLTCISHDNRFLKQGRNS